MPLLIMSFCAKIERFHVTKRYRYGQLIEVNSHSLFSKWFSESGKLVQKMFEAIQVRARLHYVTKPCDIGHLTV